MTSTFHPLDGTILSSAMNKILVAHIEGPDVPAISTLLSSMTLTCLPPDDTLLSSFAMNKISVATHPRIGGPEPPTISTHNLIKLDDYMHSQPEITPIMRSKVIDWLVKLHDDFELHNQTMYLTISIIDRFLAAENIPKSQLVCVGLTSMLIAIKFEEARESAIPDIKVLSKLVNGILKPPDFVAMEKRILGRLKWRVFVPTPYCYLNVFIAAVFKSSETITENMVYFYAKLGLMNYETIRFCPLTVAAGSVYAACATLGESHLWRETLEMHTWLENKQVMDCAEMLVCFH